MLQNLAEKGNGKSVSDMMPYLMSAAASGKKNGLHFSQNEISAVLDVMKAGKTPQKTVYSFIVINISSIANIFTAWSSFFLFSP